MSSDLEENNTPAATGTLRAPTEKDAMFFMYILGSMTNKPEVDWEKVATLGGYKSGGVARIRYGQIKRQVGFKEDGSAPAFIPPKPRGKKEKGEVGSGTHVTPSKVKKTPTPRKKKVTAKVQEALDTAAVAFPNLIIEAKDDEDTEG